MLGVDTLQFDVVEHGIWQGQLGSFTIVIAGNEWSASHRWLVFSAIGWGRFRICHAFCPGAISSTINDFAQLIWPVCTFKIFVMCPQSMWLVPFVPSNMPMLHRSSLSRSDPFECLSEARTIWQGTLRARRSRLLKRARTVASEWRELSSKNELFVKHSSCPLWNNPIFNSLLYFVSILCMVVLVH